jgi:hypothetical protein
MGAIAVQELNRWIILKTSSPTSAAIAWRIAGVGLVTVSAEIDTVRFAHCASGLSPTQRAPAGQPRPLAIRRSPGSS